MFKVRIPFLCFQDTCCSPARENRRLRQLYFHQKILRYKYVSNWVQSLCSSDEVGENRWGLNFSYLFLRFLNPQSRSP